VVAVTAAVPCNFSLFHSMERNCKFVKNRGGVIRLAINFEKPDAARRARMLCGIFFAMGCQS
jgi:hypothetical protein